MSSLCAILIYIQRTTLKPWTDYTYRVRSRGSLKADVFTIFLDDVGILLDNFILKYEVWPVP